MLMLAAGVIEHHDLTTIFLSLAVLLGLARILGELATNNAYVARVFWQTFCQWGSKDAGRLFLRPLHRTYCGKGVLGRHPDVGGENPLG